MAPAGGGMEGGAAGAAPAGGAPGMGAAASVPPDFKVTKHGKGGKSLKDQQKNVPPPTFIKLTKLEQKMYKILQGINVPYKLFGQYQVKVAGNAQPFLLDFAYPAIGVCAEADGKAWHETAEAVSRDKARDLVLANYGWRVLRFKEDAIEENPQEVAKVIASHVADAAKTKHHKKAEDGRIIKTASTNFENISKENLIIHKIELENNLGDLFLIKAKD